MYNNMRLLTHVCVALCALSVLSVNAQEQPKKKNDKSWKESKSPMLQGDFPYTKACIEAKFPANNISHKGVAIILDNDAFACFDTDLLRYSAGWTGNYITARGVAFDGAHGGHPAINGEQKWGTPMLPGWDEAKAAFNDPRPEPFGPVPKSLARWDGLYVSGMTVTLSYTVLDTKIFEQPSSVVKDGQTGFVRTFKTAKAKKDMVSLIAEVAGAKGEVKGNQAILTATNGTVTIAALVDAPKGVTLKTTENGRVLLSFAKGAAAGTFKLVIWNGATADTAKFAALTEGKPALVEFEKGAAPHWPEPVITQGVLANSKTPDEAYVLDKLTAPENNPWNRRVRFGGMDFFADGTRAALSTWDGDVWVVSGIDEKLDKLVWRRFASGGYETLGLKIVNDVIYTSGRDEITRYHDLNKDGEADYYENFNNEIKSSRGFHEFTFDLQTDKQGNFYVAKAGPVRGGGRGFADQDGKHPGNGSISAHSGTMLKISKDGSKLEVFATGFRAPNGFGIGPDDQITTSDNEGTWVPTTPINWVKKDGFYGVEDLAHKSPLPEFKQPLCWLPHNGPENFDNSGGGQVWVTSKQWGPFAGSLLHLSYGKCRLYLVLNEEVKGQMQGGVVQLPVRFTSSAMRAKFNPKDGQLYIAGLKGWQTDAANNTGFDRVRYNNKPVHSVEKLHVTKTGVDLTFTQPLNQKDAEDIGNYSVKRWNYERAEHYGSPEFNVTDPKKQGRETVEVKSAKLSADGRTVTLELADVRPVMQQMIKVFVTAKDGAEIKQDIVHTINVVP
jgi:hypothetical protein